MLLISRVLINDIFIAIFQTAFTGKQITNKDHCATHYRNKVFIPYKQIESLELTAHFYQKLNPLDD